MVNCENNYNHYNIKFSMIKVLFPLSAVDCGMPPPPDNGQVTVTETTFGSTATYTCDSDCYELQPNVITRTCLSNHTWSGEDPQCRCKCRLFSWMSMLCRHVNSYGTTHIKLFSIDPMLLCY